MIATTEWPLPLASSLSSTSFVQAIVEENFLLAFLLHTPKMAPRPIYGSNFTAKMDSFWVHSECLLEM